MDRIGLQTIHAELLADAAEARKAYAAACDRMALSGLPALEAASFNLVRLYNIIEQMAVRVAKAFENHIDDDSGWHAELMRRVSIEITGVRPPLWPAALADPLRQLRGFRHVITHAYDLTLDADRLRLVMRDAETVVQALEAACETFVREVARRESLE
jgi:hypothetical protein